ncbi:hypothetical protein Q9295_10100 [Xinfangfangia sp. CPCC 101601]|uniref:IS66 family transposase n=1 Tax=Pseudogemmobacter lacusdianii TaxID=3069608 RepID=A0ABU0VY91_9RHOB|nr:hypothetical protein [Xinfangfangia sp. CPCC 101601]MDQ2066729.1 hypothetical protein [Xinfangfangia sp. CPCC 101601]
MSDRLFEMMDDIEVRTGAFEPGLAVEALRESGDHLIADLIEGLVDRIEELQRKLERTEARLPLKQSKGRKRR